MRKIKVCSVCGKEYTEEMTTTERIMGKAYKTHICHRKECRKKAWEETISKFKNCGSRDK